MKKLILAAAALLATFGASAQDKGDWAFGPTLNIYAHTGDGAVVGIGAYARYNVLDALRIEPGLTILCQSGCSIDVNVDVHYLFDVAPDWKLYPLAGLSANDLYGWSCGINVGVGTDYAVAQRWDLSAGLKYRIQTARYARNPFIISLGATYRF